MNNVKKCVLISLLIGILPSFSVHASRKDTACEINSKKCESLSNNFSEPYCLSKSDRSIDSEIDHTDCIWTSLTNSLSSARYNTDVTLGKFETENLIKTYCWALLWTWNSWRIYYAKPSQYKDSWDREQTFDSRQSLFVYALCSSFKNADWITPFLTENAALSWAFKDEDLVTILKLKQKSGWKDLCSLSDNPGLPECDMSIYATEIFSAIMTDIFKIKYAQVMHVDSAEDFASKSKDKVVEFMSGYFDMRLQYKELKNEFPQTVDVLESNQKYYKKVLDTVKIIDNTAMADKALVSKCPIMWNMTWVNFIACALHSSQWKWFSLTPSFVSMVENEVMHYKIFKSYIQYWIEKKQTAMSVDKRDEKSIREYAAKALDFDWYANLQLDATKRALHTFEEFNTSYPLHIWLLLYQEKIKRFRDLNLSPIVTIFYSLSEKLQNVQLTK